MSEEEFNITDGRHASLDDLISIRDGEWRAASAHISDCEFCQARLEEVHSAGEELRDHLLFEAERPVPKTAWAAIQAQIAERDSNTLSQTMGFASSAPSIEHTSAQNVFAGGKATSFWSSINTAIYSLAAAIVFTGSVSLYTFQGQQQARVEARELQASIQSLMDNSRGLESVLQEVAAQNSALSLSDQSAVERLQWRLMMVDQKIHESESSNDVSYEQIKALWADRIDALNELNKLYYTNQVSMNNGEI